MKILHIIGNGFDLNLGLKTSFSDFNKTYQSINAENINIQKLKKNIKKRFENWSDLELELGNYTTEIKNIQEFDQIYQDITEKLSQYLIKEEERLKLDLIDKKKLIQFLVNPELELPLVDQKSINDLKKAFYNQHWEINIATFNYTEIIEKIFEHSFNDLILDTRENKYKTILKKIHHIHGYTNKRMILGVNDVSQVKNKIFKDDIDIIESLIKSNCNTANKRDNENSLKQLINYSNVICLFGSSIGKTDKIWWEHIGSHISRGNLLVIFDKTNPIPPLNEHLKARREREVKKKFLDLTLLDETQKKSIEDRIIVAVNTNMFNLKKTNS